MEEQELKSLWREYDKRLNESLSLNYKNLEEIQKLKASSALRPAKTVKIIAIIWGFFWVLFLGYLLAHSFELSKIFFLVSVGILFITYLITIAIYIWHLVLIREFDNSQTVVEGQQKLATLHTSLLWIVRLIFLELPLYSTWYISFDWIRDSPLSFWLIQVPIILGFTILGIWLYRNINYENRHKKWFKILFSSPEWTSVIKAADFLNEIKEYRKEDDSTNTYVSPI